MSITDSAPLTDDASACFGGADVRLTILTCLVLSTTLCLSAQPDDGTAYMVADLMTAPGWAYTAEYGRSGVADGILYFYADDIRYGSELWRTDGTPAGTWRVSDVAPGASDGVHQVFAAGGDAIFVATEVCSSCSPTRLWRSDGSHQGTVPGPRLTGFKPQIGTWGQTLKGHVAGDRLFFAQPSDEVVEKLWVSDGTPGSLQVIDLCSGPCGIASFDGSTPEEWASLDDLALFITAGNALWASDGSQQGTRQLRELGDGRYYLRGGQLGDELLFYGFGAAGSSSLWLTDGTPSGTRQLIERSDGGWAFDPTIIGDLAYLRGGNGEIWRTDGTAVETVQVGQIGCGMGNIVPAGEWLLFRSSCDGAPNQLVRWDGTSTGGEVIASIDSIGSLIPLNGLVTFWGHNGEASGLWVSNGTHDGTRLLREIESTHYWPDIVTLGPDRGVVIFVKSGESSRLLTLWHSDGTTSGTAVVKEICQQPPSSNPGTGTPFAGEIYFAATTPSGRGLWASDGTTAGTRLISTGVSNPWRMIAGDQLFIVSWTEDWTDQLWVLPDPADEPRQLLECGRIAEAVMLGERLLFIANDETGDDSLWISDGSEEGTLRVDNQLQGARSLTVYGDAAYLYGSYDPPTSVLLRYDGERLEQVTELPDTEYSPRELVATDQALYFVTNWEIWCYDPATSGMDEVSVPVDGTSLSEYMWDFTPTSQTLFVLVSRRGSDGGELWKVAGDELVLVHDLRHDGGPGFPSELTSAGDRLFLSLFHEATGVEPWISDGTTAGTVLVRDIFPGRRGSGASLRGVVDGLILLAADNGVTGYELWVSDGSMSGTRPLTDIAPGRLAANPGMVAPLGSLVMFSADDGTTGQELWAMPRQALQSRDNRPRRGGRPG
jgi:ELWxxDGT repeat protein